MTISDSVFYIPITIENAFELLHYNIHMAYYIFE